MVLAEPTGGARSAWRGHGNTEGWWEFDSRPAHILWAASPVEAGGEAGGITPRAPGLRDTWGHTLLTAPGHTDLLSKR